MAELRSFKDVIANEFYNDIWESVSSFIESSPGGLDRSTFHVAQPDEAELLDLIVYRVNITDSVGDKILFDVIVTTEIKISETIHRDREIDGVEQWFKVSCRGDLCHGLRNFAIRDVVVYSKTAAGRSGRLSDDMVPVIAKDQFDKVAESFLETYYPEALTDPMPLPTREVAARMGLKIKGLHLSRHFTLIGIMVFNDCTVEYYDQNEQEYKPLEVEGGTILVDPDVFFMRCVGCWNNTVIHECVHWYKHKKYHELAGMYDKSAARISCRVNEYDKRQKEWTPIDWMEWHANGIAPRILMPKATTVLKIEELIRENAFILDTDDRLVVLESVLSELADFFQVSKTAAKIRMIELGYPEVEGIYSYVNDHYISSYAFDADSKSQDQTYSISLSDSFFEYFSNQDFRKLVDTGHFTYVDGHYVIDDPKYIRHTDGGIGLTDYTKAHVDECCIRFDLKYNPSAKTDIVVYLHDIKFRKATPDYDRVPSFNADSHNMKLLASSEELRRLHTEYNEEGNFLNRPFANYAQAAKAHIERLGIGPADFAEATLVSDRTYCRIMAGNPPQPTLVTVIRICIGLKLGGVLGEQLLQLAGYTLNNTPQQVAYKKLLYSYRGHSVYECDEVLVALGLNSILPHDFRGSETD